MLESNVIHRGPFVNLTWLDPWIDPGPRGVSTGVWHQDAGAGSFGSCGLGAGASMDQTF